MDRIKTPETPASEIPVTNKFVTYICQPTDAKQIDEFPKNVQIVIRH
jgi:hypothetical protein